MKYSDAISLRGTELNMKRSDGSYDDELVDWGKPSATAIDLADIENHELTYRTENGKKYIDTVDGIPFAEWKNNMDEAREGMYEDGNELFEEYELEAYLGDFASDYDIAAIIDEATVIDYRTGNRYWKNGIDLAEICQNHEIFKN